MTMTDFDWRPEQQQAGLKLKALLISELPTIKQVEVAEVMGISEAAISSYLIARRQWPEGFEQRFRDAVERLRGAAA